MKDAPGRASWLSLVLLIALVLGASKGWAWWQDRQIGTALRTLARHGDILIFTTDTCFYCAQARAWLALQAVPWQECNVDRDSHCLQAFQAQGAPGVPLVQARGQWQLGFDKNWLLATLQSSPNRPSSPLP
jgi:glutaredoxin